MIHSGLGRNLDRAVTERLTRTGLVLLVFFPILIAAARVLSHFEDCPFITVCRSRCILPFLPPRIGAAPVMF